MKLPNAPQLQTITEIGVAVADLPKYAAPVAEPPHQVRETQEGPAADIAASEPAPPEPAPEPPPPPPPEMPAAEAPADGMTAKTAASPLPEPPHPEPPTSEPPPLVPPVDEDAPGALMDVLSRADAEAAKAEAKRKST